MITDIETVADISILHLQGDLGPHEVQHITRVIESFVAKNWNQIVLNFQDVSHIDYKTVFSLLTAHFSVQNDGDQHFSALKDDFIEGEAYEDIFLSRSLRSRDWLKFANLNEYLRKILNVSGVHDYCETYDSLAEAILSFEDRSHTLSCSC